MIRRWIAQPIVWILDVWVQWAGASIDAACELFDLDGEDH